MVLCHIPQQLWTRLNPHPRGQPSIQASPGVCSLCSLWKGNVFFSTISCPWVTTGITAFGCTGLLLSQHNFQVVKQTGKQEHERAVRGGLCRRQRAEQIKADFCCQPREQKRKQIIIPSSQCLLVALWSCGGGQPQALMQPDWLLPAPQPPQRLAPCPAVCPHRLLRAQAQAHLDPAFLLTVQL